MPQYSYVLNGLALHYLATVHFNGTDCKVNVFLHLSFRLGKYL